ncbi:MAG: hypothetical protein MUF53_09480 [Gemmatimonadaceae bacterium]|jgi:class 3 adenylate cyclase|nr:hypothetical protein [Gemmatimonadaceae bacterium]
MVYRSGPHDALPNIRIEREPTQRRLRVALNGATAHPDFAAAVAAAGAALHDGPSYSVVIDLRGSRYAPTQQEAQQISEQMIGLRAVLTGPVAILAEAPLQFGVARMIASFAEASGMPVAAFRGDEDAERWILVESQRRSPAAGLVVPPHAE